MCGKVRVDPKEKENKRLQLLEADQVLLVSSSPCFFSVFVHRDNRNERDRLLCRRHSPRSTVF